MRHTARFAIALSLFAGFATGCNTTPPIAVVSPFEEEVVVTPSVPIEVAFQPGTTPASFQAVLDGTDVTSSFTVTASGASASLPIGSLGAGTGRNRLVVSIASGSGTAKDVAEFSVSQAQAVATVVTPSSAGLLVGGPQARGRVGDYALYNDLIRVVIDDITPVDDSGKSIRSAYGAHVYGGNIIDGDLQRGPGDPDRDSFEVVTPLINVESTPHYTSATIVNDGTDGGPAVIRFEGVDDIFDTQNLSSLIVFLGGGAFALPAQFDDHDLPIEISTEYSLAPGENFVRITTAIKNLGPSDLAIPIGDWVNGGGEGEIFFPGLGYGGTSGAGTMFRLDADYLAWVANGPTMAGVSYGYVPDAQGGNDAVSNGGLNIILNDASILDLLFGATPHFVVPAGGTNSYSRKFVIGNGDTTPISTVRDRTLGVSFGTVEGFVRSGGQPVAGARVSVVSLGGDLFQSLKVIAALETDADGHYIGTVPVGVYNLVVNAEGYPAPSAVGLNVPVDGAGVANMDLALDAAGFVTVDVVDEGAAPSPAKVSLVGIDPSPSSTVSLNLLGFITATGGVFRNDGDFLPRGVTAVKFAGLDGHVASFPVEPGQYQVVVSRGPEYDVDRQTVTVGAGATVAVNATVRKVLDTAGFVSSDFHQHQQASYDAPASDPTRVLTNIAEGLDFFVSTDHDFISDLSPAIAAAGASSTIGYAKGAEITPSDYGHINPWPLVQDPTTRNMGAFDWSGGEVPGTDFPSLGRFSKAPAEIYAGLRALPPAGHPRVVQINHLNALQMGTFEALGIDTGLVPPQSNFSPADFRLDPSSANLFDPGFDAMELWIGSNNDELSQLTEQNLGDWFNLMNQGLVKTATSDSDSHVAKTVQVGAPRTWVASSTDAPASVDPDEIAQSILGGKAVCSNGPFVTTSITAASTGETASLALGAPRIASATDGQATLQVNVQAAPWVDFDSIEVFVSTTPNGVDADGNAATPPEYRVTPTVTLHAGTDFAISPVAVNGSSRNEASVSVPLAIGATDKWVVVVVKGTSGSSRTLFPMIPNDVDASQSLADLFVNDPGEAGVRAFAFTNQLFVDANGNHQYEAPLAAAR
ncbi:MAG: CehA/McbA family metallohydrolase [Deltaproteobacteria bacterium]|nr:CehA/McbA family metallohydrolase [Deltaproteobacteria bacterium]